MGFRDLEGEWADFPASPEPMDPFETLSKKGRATPLAPIPHARRSRQDDDTTPHSRPNEPSGKTRRRIRSILLPVAVLAGLVAAGYFGSYWWTVGRFLVSTDDAYVGAHAATLAARISGYIATIPVEDNQHVRAGDVIATIDDGDYQLAVDSARDKIATQKATIARIGQQITAQQAAVDQAKSQVDSARAGATRAQLELDRQQALAIRDFASRQKLEQAQADRDQSIAAVENAKAALQSAAANVDVLKGQQEEAARTLKELETSLAKAERDLAFAVLRAPFDGVVGNRAVQSGDYVQPGQRLASLVPLDEVYIDANFKETQISRLRPGQTVQIGVDALPDRRLEGSVVNFAPASGSVFSLLPPDNATGNFTKIVQRVAVRVRVPADVAREGVLRPGMSVVVSVDTKPGATAGCRQAAAR
jgi:membrane fusion protein (multidrug efflux system)